MKVYKNIILKVNNKVVYSGTVDENTELKNVNVEIVNKKVYFKSDIKK